MSGKVPKEVKAFRNFMLRLGYYGVSFKKMEQADLYAVLAFDRMNEKVTFSRIYSLDDMRCITHANDIFWRYVK